MHLLIICLAIGLGLNTALADSDNHQMSLAYEVRQTDSQTGISVYDKPSVQSQPVGELQPGDLIIANGDYTKALRDEQDNRGRWVQLSAVRPVYMYAHWKVITTINPMHLPLRLKFAGKVDQVFTVFDKPGLVSWKSCLHEKQRCIAWPSSSSDLQLLETRYQNADDSGELSLFYKISYDYTDTMGHRKQGHGWVPSGILFRDIDHEGPLLQSRKSLQQQGLIVLTQKQYNDLIAKTKKSTLQGLSVSNRPPESILKSVSRWKSQATKTDNKGRGPASAASTSVSQSQFSFHIDYDLYCKMGQLGITKTGGTQDVDSNSFGGVVGVAGVAPLLLDFEVAASLSYFYPFSAVKDRNTPQLLLFDQYVTYALDWGSKDTTFRGGIGWSLLWLLSEESDYGFKGLVGLNGRLSVDTYRFLTSLSMGPTANSSGFSLKNYRMQANVLWRLQPKLGYDSWNLTLDYSYEQFNLRYKGAESKLNRALIGVLKTL